MKVIQRCALCIVASLSVCGLVAGRASADPLYSLTDLGPGTPTANASGQNGLVTPSSTYPYLTGQNQVNSNGNYLTALSQSQQVAFQSGSFDVYAHPASSSLYGQAFYPDQSGGRYDVVAPASGSDVIYSFSMTTSNNLGVTAGTATELYSQGPALRQVTFQPDPHMVVPTANGAAGPAISSPGYLIGIAPGAEVNLNFYGTVSGINDHNIIAYTLYQYSSPQATLVPHVSGLIGSNGFPTDQSLGSLGGTNGAAYALNNSNQVVGWSQIASGAPHAFLYSGGSLQDLNSLIPSSSGIVLTSAVGIDAAGEIMAYGTDASGQTHEYFLTPTESPVPEPSTLAVMFGMIVALAVRQARVRRPSEKRN